MPKTPHTFRLSKQAEQDIDAIVKRYPYVHDATGAIEFVVWTVAHHVESLPHPDPAARPARRTAKAKEQ